MEHKSEVAHILEQIDLEYEATRTLVEIYNDVNRSISALISSLASRLNQKRKSVHDMHLSFTPSLQT